MGIANFDSCLESVSPICLRGLSAEQITVGMAGKREETVSCAGAFLSFGVSTF